MCLSVFSYIDTHVCLKQKWGVTPVSDHVPWALHLGWSELSGGVWEALPGSVGGQGREAGEGAEQRRGPCACPQKPSLAFWGVVMTPEMSRAEERAWLPVRQLSSV